MSNEAPILATPIVAIPVGQPVTSVPPIPQAASNPTIAVSPISGGLPKAVNSGALIDTSELDGGTIANSGVLNEYLRPQKSARILDRILAYPKLLISLMVLLFLTLGGGGFGYWQNVKNHQNSLVPTQNIPVLNNSKAQNDKTYVLTVNGELRVTGAGAVATKLTANDIVANRLMINGATVVDGDITVRTINGSGHGLTDVNAATLNGASFSQITDLINASAGIKGTGTPGHLAVYSGNALLQDSLISQAGSVITIDGTLVAQNLQGSGALISDLNASNITLGRLGTTQGGTGLDSSNAGVGTLLIGNGGGFTLGNLAQGSGISITNASGSISVAVDSTVCTSTNNLCTASGGSIASGTTGTISRFTSPTTLGDSIISQPSGTTVVIGGTLSVANALQGNSLSIGGGAFAVNGSGAITAATGLTSSGSINFSSLNAVGVAHTDSSGHLSTSAVLLGSDTSGSYVANLGSLTGLTTVANSGAGATPSLSVVYGTVANSAAQGNTSLSFSGSGNLTGTVNGTAGGGITSNSLTVVDNPTFGGLLTANGGLSAAGATITGNLTQSGVGTITFGALGGGIVQADNSGVVSSSNLDRNSSLLTGQTSLANGGTGASTASNARLNLAAAGSGVNADITSLAAVTSVGSSGTALTLQGNASTVLSATDSGFTTAVGFAAPTSNVSYIFGTAPTGSYAICTTTGNCSGVGGGVTTPGGSSGTIALFTGSSTIANSLLSQAGTTVTVAGTLAASILQGSGATITDLNGTNITSGVVGVSVGGTGGTSFTDNGIVFGNGTGPLHVTAAGTNGQCLFAITNNAPIWTDCAVAANGAMPGGPAGHDLGGNYPDPIVIGLYNTPLDISNLAGGNLLLYNGSSWANAVVSGDLNVNASGLATIANGAVSNAKLANSSITVSAGTGLGGGGTLALGSSITLNVTPDLSLNSLALTNALTVANGGTGATTSVAARTNLGAAANGSNSDITALNSATSLKNTAGSLAVGDTTQTLSLQGNAATTLSASASGFVTAVGFATPTANVNYRLATAAAGNYDICTTTANCVGLGGGVTTTGGTTNTIALFTGTQAIGNSILSQAGTTVTVAGTLSATALQGSGAAITSLNGSNIASGTIGVSVGGTGSTSFATNGVLYGNGSGALQVTAAGTMGQCLVGSTGGAPTWASCSSAAIGTSPGGSAGGDLSGSYPNPTVVALYGKPLSIGTLVNGNVLTYNGSSWVNASSISLSGNAAFGGTLSVVGATTLSSTLTVAGQVTASANLVVKASSGTAAALTIQDSAGSSSLEIRTGTAADANTFIGLGSGAVNTAGSGKYNTAVGSAALQANTSGSNNTALGYQALNVASSGGFNVALGGQSLSLLTTGSYNTAIGYQALSKLTGASDNTAIGYLAGAANTNGADNLYVGYLAGTANKTGSFNIYLGDSAAPNIASGSGNVVQGVNAFTSITSGANNTINGYQAGYGNNCSVAQGGAGCAVSNLTISGANAGVKIQTGSDNTSLYGVSSGAVLTTGAGNSAFGYQSLLAATTGSKNAVFGDNALRSNVTGANNIALGYQAGYSNTGSGNVFLGYQAGYSETGSNKLYIANSNSATPLVQGDFNTAALTINGTLGVTGDTSLTGNLAINGGNVTSSAATVNLFNVTPTTINFGGNATTVSIGKTGGTTTFNGALTVTQAVTFNGTLTAKAATFTGIFTVNGHIISGNASGTTTVASGAAANCGSSATPTITGNDTAGYVTFTAGIGSCAAGTLVTITFASAYSAAPVVVLTPRGAASAALQYYATSGTTTATIGTGTSASANASYGYNYQVIQ